MSEAPEDDGVALTSMAHPGSVPVDLNPESLEEIEIEIPFVSVHKDVMAALIDKAQALVDLMNEDERHHGGLTRPETMRARNELALELQRFK